MKHIEIEVDTSCGTAGLPVELLPPHFSPHTWLADERAAFDIIAIATSPPTYVGFTLADTWAHRRYLSSLHVSSDLRLRREWEDLDSHQKTILADDFGVGFPLLYLAQKLQLQHFSPTGWWLKALENITGIPIRIKKKKNGPPKLPDYICVDSAGFFHAVENKGTQTSIAKLNEQIRSGVVQIENLRNSSLTGFAKAYFRSWIVGGIFIPQYRSRSTARIVFADPDFASLLDVLEDHDDLRRAREAIRLVNLCQQLTSIGLRQLGTALFNGRVRPGYRELVRGTADGNEEAKFMGFRRRGTRFVRSSAFHTFESDNPIQLQRQARIFTLSYSIDLKVLSALTSCIDQAGHVNRPALNAVLNNIAPLVHPIDPPDNMFLKRRALGKDNSSHHWRYNSTDLESSIETPFKIRYKTVEKISRGF